MITSNGVVSANESLLTLEERTVQNRLGYKVELYGETGEFNDVVFMPDDTSVVHRFHFVSINELEFELKEMLKGYYAYLLPRYLPDSIRAHHAAIVCLSDSILIGNKFDEAIDDAVMANPARFVSPIKLLIRYLILQKYGV